jgi:hypothetical protein
MQWNNIPACKLCNWSTNSNAGISLSDLGAAATLAYEVIHVLKYLRRYMQTEL